MALPSGRTIVITRTFAAPRSVVFDAWTIAKHVAQWWDPGGAPLALCEIDLRPGGEFRFVAATGPSAQRAFTGSYREIVRPTRLVMVTPGPSPNSESVGTLVFDEHDGMTTLTLTIESATEADRDALLRMRVDAGTRQTLENLADYLRRS